jgi:hypothetical protein
MVLYAQLSTTGVLCDIPCQHILTLSLANATIGMPHGTFFRKGVIHLDDGRPLQLKDLVVGGDIKMLGQEFFITDADEFTRKYFQYVYTQSSVPCCGAVDPKAIYSTACYSPALRIAVDTLSIHRF